MSYREACEADWIKAVPHLVEAIQLSPACTLVDVDVELVIAYLIAAATRGGAYVVSEKYLVVYDLHPIWYSPNNLAVNEQLVLCIDPAATGSILAPLKFLVSEKERREAVTLLVGDLLHANQEKYGRVLMKLGFQKVNSIYAA